MNPAVKALHDQRLHGCRGGVVENDQITHQFVSSCFNGVTGTMCKPKGKPFVIFCGDGPDTPFEILHDQPKLQEFLMGYTRDWNDFTGTPKSKRWIEFLLSDDSPWRELHQYMDTQDADEINNSGFIFKDGCGEKLPNKLLYNFCIAQRFCWEQYRHLTTFLKLWDEGYSPTMALFIAMNFEPMSADPYGMYQMIWPWNFLEDGGIECAARFIKGKPANIDGNHMPNVAPLWSTGPSNKAWIDRMSKEPLLLEAIVGEIEQEVSRQEAL